MNVALLVYYWYVIGVNMLNYWYIIGTTYTDDMLQHHEWER